LFWHSTTAHDLTRSIDLAFRPCTSFDERIALFRQTLNTKTKSRINGKGEEKMKRVLTVLVVVVLSLPTIAFGAESGEVAATGISAASGEAAGKPASELKTDAEKIGYIIGRQIGGQLKEISSEISLPVLLKAIEDAIQGKEGILTEEETSTIMQEFSAKMQKKQTEERDLLAEKNKMEGEVFLKVNAAKEGVITTASGLQYIVLTEGTGPKPIETDKVTVNYRGTLIDGTEFDSSYGRGKPQALAVGGVVPGFKEALQLMSVGSKYRLFIPSSLAYREYGSGDKIGPNATLIFEMELVSIEPPQEKPAQPIQPGQPIQPIQPKE
jgi:FKBP-type peptidyl-prolyl cis-trans isomerase